VQAALRDTPVVFLQGPRQAGKTTLVQSLKEDGHGAAYFTFDDAAVLAAAQSDPDGFVANLPNKVILDEVQRVPDLFRAIKRSVDTQRQPGRFLLTGSANALVLPRVSESLAGRMEVLSLSPFSQGEIESHREHFVDVCFAKDFSPGNYKDSGWAAPSASFKAAIPRSSPDPLARVAKHGLGPTSPRSLSGTFATSQTSKACANCRGFFA